jgi:hypothetical protein
MTDPFDFLGARGSIPELLQVPQNNDIQKLVQEHKKTIARGPIESVLTDLRKLKVSGFPQGCGAEEIHQVLLDAYAEVASTIWNNVCSHALDYFCFGQDVQNISLDGFTDKLSLAFLGEYPVATQQSLHDITLFHYREHTVKKLSIILRAKRLYNKQWSSPQWEAILDFWLPASSSKLMQRADIHRMCQAKEDGLKRLLIA